MKKTTLVLAATLSVLACVTVGGCNGLGDWFSSKKVPLWNSQNFTGWTYYLEEPDVEFSNVWTIRDSVIHCTGQPFGYIRTRADHGNYKLHLEWRWLGGPLPDGAVRNSGVLLHMQEPGMIWPKCIEAQLMHGNAGDFWILGGAQVDQQKDVGKVAKQKPSQEHPIGQWNTYDILCEGTTITSHVNGVKMNQVTGASLTAGKICLQSEGAPIEFRNIYITALQ